jgi:hypothetical protein
MLSDHRAIIIEKCSGRYAPTMPNIPTSLDDSSETATGNLSTDMNANDEQVTHAITPPPNKLHKSLDIQPGDGKEILKQNMVTPSPAATGPSKQALAIHQKWLETAKALGGDKLIVSKEAAKKVIFDVLHDAFRPMNITDIFNVSLHDFIVVTMVFDSRVNIYLIYSKGSQGCCPITGPQILP